MTILNKIFLLSCILYLNNIYCAEDEQTREKLKAKFNQLLILLNEKELNNIEKSIDQLIQNHNRQIRLKTENEKKDIILKQIKELENKMGELDNKKELIREREANSPEEEERQKKEIDEIDDEIWELDAQHHKACMLHDAIGNK